MIQKQAKQTKDRLTYILTTSCLNRLGLIDIITHVLHSNHCYITELQSFSEMLNNHFFTRVVFYIENNTQTDIHTFKEDFSKKTQTLNMSWQLTTTCYKPTVVIMVSKFDHCLNDLLYRYRTGYLPIHIAAVISNHLDLEPLVKWHNIPYYHFPITKDTKIEQENKVQHILDQVKCELLILARYMQVLSTGMCKRWAGKAINIHHSLLPGFKGARPYHQAYEKGVKLVGATAHYVSEDLDEGPIIAQSVATVNHAYTPSDLAKQGMDVESQTLAKAIQHHIEKRVFLFKNKTIVFNH